MCRRTLPKEFYRDMVKFRNLSKFVLAAGVLAAVVLHPLAGIGQDLVASDDLTGGSSVFVFRRSRKAPQERLGGGRLSASRSGYYKANLNNQFAQRKKTRTDAIRSRQEIAAKAQARERNAKLKLSNTLTARAGTMVEKGDVAAAVTNYREALKVNPRNANAKLGLSQAITLQGVELASTSADEAEVLLTEAVKLDPRNDVAYAKLGEIYDLRGQDAKAADNYEKALTIDSGFTSLYLPLALAYVETGQIAKAETYLAKTETLGGDAVVEAKLARSRILYKQNKNEEALAVIEDAVRSDPRNAEAFTQQGAIYSRLERPDMATAAYKKAVAADPEYAPAYFDMGVLYYNAGDYRNAEASYKQVIRIQPNNYQAHAHLASTYRQQERYADANAEYRLAEQGIKDNADLYSEWGFCLGKTNEWDKAAQRLETAHKLNPDAVDQANIGWAYYNHGQQLKNQKKDEEAEQQFAMSKNASQKAIELDPKMDAAYLNLGSANNSTGDYEAAKAALDQALALRSDWIPALNQLGASYRGMNDLAAAVNQYNRVLRIDGNNVMGLFGLGSTENARGNKKEAKKAQDRLRKIDPKMADQLGNIIAGRLIDEGRRQLLRKIPRIPF